MKSRVFTPFLAAFAGSIILLIGLFLLQGTQTSRTILSGSSVAQAAQTSNAALAASSKFSVTVGIGSATVNNDTKITMIVTPTAAQATTSYTLSVDYGDKTAGTAGTATAPLKDKGSQSFNHKYTTVGNFSVVAKLFILNVGVDEIITKTVSVGEAPKAITLGVPTSAYIGQVIPFSVTGTINAVNYTFETIDVTGGKWTVAAGASQPVNFPILSTNELKITAYDPIYNATSTKTVKGLAPTITLIPSKTTASPNEVITFAQPTIKGGGKDIPGATPTLLCGKDSTEATVSGLTCTILKTTGTVTANVKFTIQPPLPSDVYSLPSANQVKPIVLYGTAASITVGGVVPTPTITPTGKSTIKIIVGKDSLEACGDTTVITAEVKDSTGKHLPSASVIFTVTDDDKTEIRSLTDTKVPTTTHFVTNKPGNVTIKAVLKDTPAISATITQQIGSLPTGDERQCTLKPPPSKDGDLQLDGDEDSSKFNDTTKRWLRIIIKFFADHPDFKDVQAIGMTADPFCKSAPITPSSTISNSQDMGCFTLKIIKIDGSELTSLTKAISFTIELNGVAWKEIESLNKTLKLLKQKGTGWEQDSNAVIDTSNLKETSATSSTLLLATTNPSLELSTTSTGLVALVADTTPAVVDTGNKVYLPLITR